jgi:hypothetical protein
MLKKRDNYYKKSLFWEKSNEFIVKKNVFRLFIIFKMIKNACQD